jgi:hypothetical protein
MNHKAIYKLYPTVVTVDDTAGAFDAQGNQVEIDLSPSVVSIELHSNQMWRDLREFYKWAKTFEKLMKLKRASKRVTLIQNIIYFTITLLHIHTKYTITLLHV